MNASPWEIAANVLNAVSIFLAGRNSLQTWWTGILGCLLFLWVFWTARLYADVTLQVFFIATSVLGWWNWLRKTPGTDEVPVRKTSLPIMAGLVAIALSVVGGYGYLLHAFTQAVSPFFDSTILAFSVLGQLLLMNRRIENWWCWLLVNAIGIPLYASRGLYLTSALSFAFLINAFVALISWRKLVGVIHETV